MSLEITVENATPASYNIWYDKILHMFPDITMPTLTTLDQFKDEIVDRFPLHGSAIFQKNRVDRITVKRKNND